MIAARAISYGMLSKSPNQYTHNYSLAIVDVLLYGEYISVLIF